VTAAILAGGLGTRLRSVFTDRPKVLVPVAGRPFLFHLLDRLECAEIDDVVLLIGHLGEQVKAALGNSYRGMSLRYSHEQAPLGTGGALRNALPFLDAPEVLLLNGDSHLDADLGKFRQFHLASGAEASLLLALVPDTSRFGRVQLDESGRIARMVEKTAAGEGWINAGVYLIDRYLIEALPSRSPLSLEREVLPQWIGNGQVFGLQHEGRFLDIGTPESYSAAENFFDPASRDKLLHAACGDSHG
jgi:NDP-sugar pyrophosphorylase family protein